MTARFNFAEVKPWWVRLGLLVLTASPLLGVTDLHGQIHGAHLYTDLILWCSYGLFVWAVVGFSVGFERLLQWLSVATITGLTVAFTGAALRGMGFWRLLESLLVDAGLSAPVPTAQEATLGLVLRLLVIMISLPLALFALQSFPAPNLLRRVVAPRLGWLQSLSVTVAVFLRMFQHVFEVATRMLVAWKEENPQLIVPRARGDWRVSLKARLGVFGWWQSAVWAWCLGLLCQALMPVPVVARDWSRFAHVSKDEREHTDG